MCHVQPDHTVSRRVEERLRYDWHGPLDSDSGVWRCKSKYPLEGMVTVVQAGGGSF